MTDGFPLKVPEIRKVIPFYGLVMSYSMIDCATQADKPKH